MKYVKHTSTFFIACLMVISLFGQTTKTRIIEYHKMLNYSRNASIFQNYATKRGDQFALKDCPYNHHEIFKFKSAKIAKERLDSTITEIKNANGQIDISKTIYSYNSDGSIIIQLEIEYYNWDKNTNQWGVIFKNEYSYENGNMIKEISSFFDKTRNLWITGGKLEVFYNSDGNETKEVRYDWDYNRGQLVESSKFEMNYDSSGKMIQSVNYSWDKTSSQWYSTMKSELVYNPDENKSTGISYNWDKTNIQWVAFLHEENTYNSNGNINQNIQYNWDEITSLWFYVMKTDYSYNNDGNETQEITYFWNRDNSKWDSWHQFEYLYNSNGTKTQEIQYEWNKESTNWKISTKSTFYYSQQNNTSITNILEKNLKFYPNPANYVLNISGLVETATISISDVNGKIWILKVVSNNENISLRELYKGIYFVRIKTSKESTVKKFIKE